MSTAKYPFLFFFTFSYCIAEKKESFTHMTKCKLGQKNPSNRNIGPRYSNHRTLNKHKQNQWSSNMLLHVKTC